MEINEGLRSEILKIVENQLDSDNPVETKKTYTRLLSLGRSDFEAKQLIGQCLVVEIFDVMKHQKTFNESRYIKNLKHLPKEPLE